MSGNSNQQGGGGTRSDDAQRTLSDAAKKLREGEIDRATAEKTKTALDFLFGSGRAFNSDDRAKLQHRANSELSDSVDRQLQDSQRSHQPEGRARESLTSGNKLDAGRLQSRQGELKEDEMRRMIETGQVKVAPEYRKALEDYYKAISK